MRGIDRVSKFLLACVVTHLAMKSVDAQEWTRFRGPNGSGVSSTEIPAEWTDANRYWKTSLPGTGHSSPVVWGERVFVMSADPQTATRYVVAINTRDGQIAWQRDYAAASHPLHARSSYASATPAVDDQHVYVCWATPQDTVLMALTHQGELAWQRSFGPFASEHGFGTSPIVYRDQVIISLLQMKPDDASEVLPTSQVVAVDRHTGETRWTTPRLTDVVSYSVPCIHAGATPDDDELIGCSTADGMFSLQASTGKPRWTVPAFTMRTVSSPIVAGDLIWATTGSGGGGNYVVAVNADTTPEIAYHVRKQAPYVPTPIVHGERLYLWFDKGIVTCARRDNGETIWQERIGGNYSGSPILAGDRLFCIDEEGTVVVVSAGDQFQLLARNRLDEPSRSTPAVSGGRIYFRTYSHLHCIGPAPGASQPLP